MHAVAGREVGLCGHAAFETFSVLSRLPGQLRRRPVDVARILTVSFPKTRYLDIDTTASLFNRLADLDLAGGAVYDALVAATAVTHGAELLTRDRRATDTYVAVGTSFTLVS